MFIKKIHGRQILDSRGNPTVECDVELENGIIGRAAVPSGASTGINEAVELRDGDPKKYLGAGVLKAVENVNSVIAKTIVGIDSEDQEKIDEKMIELDGTENKAKLGANAILSVSLACAKAAAKTMHNPLFAYIAGIKGKHSYLLPVPMMNIINGGKHANFSTDIQEYMILPVGAGSFSEALRWGAEVFHHLGKIIKEKGYDTTVGDEGGYAPQVKGGNSEPFELIAEAVANAGYSMGKDIVLGIDAAASEFFQNNKYVLRKEGKSLTSEEMVEWISDLINKYPIVSLEDCLDQGDWDGWQLLTARIGKTKQIVGDDLLVTNIKFLD
ncbi:phosphopyruvate hydratase, partial [Patescibacteria group bacterium]|nr:phosphopyruvate hydratase [Patescibacteria group bacterium]